MNNECVTKHCFITTIASRLQLILTICRWRKHLETLLILVHRHSRQFKKQSGMNPPPRCPSVRSVKHSKAHARNLTGSLQMSAQQQQQHCAVCAPLHSVALRGAWQHTSAAHWSVKPCTASQPAATKSFLTQGPTPVDMEWLRHQNRGRDKARDRTLKGKIHLKKLKVWIPGNRRRVTWKWRSLRGERYGKKGFGYFQKYCDFDMISLG